MCVDLIYNFLSSELVNVSSTCSGSVESSSFRFSLVESSLITVSRGVGEDPEFLFGAVVPV